MYEDESSYEEETEVCFYVYNFLSSFKRGSLRICDIKCCTFSVKTVVNLKALKTGSSVQGKTTLLYFTQNTVITLF